MEQFPQNSSAKNDISDQVEVLLKRKNDMFKFKSETEDLDDLADEIFDALADHTASQNETTEAD